MIELHKIVYYLHKVVKGLIKYKLSDQKIIFDSMI